MCRSVKGSVVHITVVPHQAEDQVRASNTGCGEAYVEVFSLSVTEIPPFPCNQECSVGHKARLALLIVLMAHHTVEVRRSGGGGIIKVQCSGTDFRHHVGHIVVPVPFYDSLGESRAVELYITLSHGTYLVAPELSITDKVLGGYNTEERA